MILLCVAGLVHILHIKVILVLKGKDSVNVLDVIEDVFSHKRVMSLCYYTSLPTHKYTFAEILLLFFYV